jgi:choline transport protein
MSEECGNAGISVPRAIMWTVVGNGLMGFFALVAFIFSIPSTNAALNDPSGFPLIYALRLRFDVGVVIAFVFINWLVLTISNIAFQAATSRQMFAFARDGALPFSRWIGHVSPRFHVPVNAVLLTGLISVVLCLIDLGSSTAFSAILSLAAVGQMGTYGISITCVLYRRLTDPQSLPKSRWTFGVRTGAFINAVGAGYAWFVLIFGFFPSGLPVTAGSMNWAIAMFGGVLVLSLAYFLVVGKRMYVPPVTKTEAYRQ